MTVATVVGRIASGQSRGRILRAYPDLEPADRDEALPHAARRLQEREEDSRHSGPDRPGVSRSVEESPERRTDLAAFCAWPDLAGLISQTLKALKPGRILITNRNPDRAEAAAARWNGQAVPFDRLGQALIEADLVVSTTAATEPIVTLDQYVRVQRARRNRLALILDIAIPRDFDPRIGDLDQVALYHVDDLRAQADQNRARRQKGVDPALVIIEHETAACYAMLRHQEAAGALLQQLGNHADQIRQRELSNLFAGRPDLTDADREAIAHMAMRLQNQFLHHPRAAVRSAVTESSHEHPHPVLSAVRHLFGLGDHPQPSSLKKIT